MTLREKLLMGGMCVALVGGGIQFGLDALMPESKAPAGPDLLQQSRAVSGEVTAALQGLTLSDGQRYILATALRPATNNPFHAPSTEAAQKVSADVQGLSYTGYVQAGKGAFAIIGGLEYSVGDVLPNTGDVIRAIRPDSVTLYSPSRRAEWTLPYTGDDM